MATSTIKRYENLRIEKGHESFSKTVAGSTESTEFIPFSVPYATAPTVVLTPRYAYNRRYQVETITESGFTVAVATLSGGTTTVTTPYEFYWIAVGE